MRQRRCARAPRGRRRASACDRLHRGVEELQRHEQAAGEREDGQHRAEDLHDVLARQQVPGEQAERGEDEGAEPGDEPADDPLRRRELDAGAAPTANSTSDRREPERPWP